MSEKLASVKVFKFDPLLDDNPRYITYREIPYEDRSVLDVLRYIYENIDQTLSFRCLCTKGFCGGCAVIINGVPSLACRRLAEEEMTIEPHHKFEIIKDLVIKYDNVK